MNKKNEVSQKNTEILNQNLVEDEIQCEDEDYNIEYFNMTKNANTFDITESRLVSSQVKQCFDLLGLSRKDSLIITGVGACGKTTLVKCIAKRIVTNNCPTQLKKTTILMLNSESFEDTFDFIYLSLKKLLKSCMESGIEKLILFFDDLYNYPEVLMEEFNTIIKLLKEEFDFKLLKFIATSDIKILNDQEEYGINKFSNIMEIFYMDKGFEEMVNLLNYEIKKLEKKHSVLISDSLAVKTAILCNIKAQENDQIFDFNLFLDTIDKLLSTTALNGNTSASLKDLISIFFDYQNIYEDDCKKTIKNVAIHEVGHALIALLNPEMFYIQAIKGMTNNMEDNGGITMVIEHKNFHTKKDLIIIVAHSLAGRIASSDNNNGGIDDIKEANEIARQWVMQSGLFKKMGNNFYVNPVDNNFTISEKYKELIEDEVNKIIKKATKYCKKMFKKHKKFIRILSKELVDKIVLSNSEIMILWEKYKSEEKSKKK